MSFNKNNNNLNIKLKNEIEEIKSKNDDLFSLNPGLKDLSHLKTYTIDDIDTIEVDDAISLERIADNYKLWIHIASPAVHIDYNSTVDKSARDLISTVYLCKKNIYMFPKILINEIFSLTKKKINASLSIGVVFKNDGSVSNTEIVQSIINPNYQLSYNEADELIDYAPKEEEDLSIISRILEKRRLFRKTLGAKEILESNGKVIVNGNIPSIKVIEPTLSRILISEAMILYGDLISNYTKKNNIPVPYRVQDMKQRVSNDKNSFLDNDILKNFLLKKSMGKSYYSTEALRHDSLGLGCYLQASSPIRRYSDLLVHYQINKFLNNKKLISKEEIEENIININHLARQNLNRYREDQRVWLNKWFEINSIKSYRVIFLNWINRFKNICIIYFIEFKITSICFIKTKLGIEEGDIINIINNTQNYNELLCFELLS
tara:strand:- start:3760 stop:5058 length:1299 start_codon:yes stop_codon:yes gene_type:complete